MAKIKKEKKLEIYVDENGQFQQKINCNTWEYGLMGYVMLVNFTEMLNKLAKDETKIISVDQAFNMLKNSVVKGDEH